MKKKIYAGGIVVKRIPTYEYYAIEVPVIPELYSISDWLRLREIEQRYIDKFPKAKAAAEIKKSPLYEALK